MENYCRAQTPLTYQHGSSQFDTSLMFIQNNFEWSHQTTSSTDTQSVFQHSSYNTNTNDFNSFAFDQSCFELNNFNSIDNSSSNNNNNDSQTSPFTGGYFDCFTEDSPLQDEEVYELNLDDSLKNVLSEIEAIPSVFLEDISSSSPSSVSSTHDQEILSPGFDLSLWSSVPVSTCGSPSTCNFSVPDLDVSSGESEVSSDDASKQLRKVNNKNNNKSGRVNKRESNKVAAVRYRQRKTKERDQLFQECELYGKKNEDLKEKIGDLEQQIGFIKSLLMQALAQKK